MSSPVPVALPRHSASDRATRRPGECWRPPRPAPAAWRVNLRIAQASRRRTTRAKAAREATPGALGERDPWHIRRLRRWATARGPRSPDLNIDAQDTPLADPKRRRARTRLACKHRSARGSVRVSDGGSRDRCHAPPRGRWRCAGVPAVAVFDASPQERSQSMPSRMERRHAHCGLQSRRLEPPARRAPTHRRWSSHTRPRRTTTLRRRASAPRDPSWDSASVPESGTASWDTPRPADRTRGSPLPAAGA